MNLYRVWRRFSKKTMRRCAHSRKGLPTCVRQDTGFFGSDRISGTECEWILFREANQHSLVRDGPADDSRKRRGSLIIVATAMAYIQGMICRPWITIHGVRIYAKDYGKRAFCFFPRGQGRKEPPQSSGSEREEDENSGE